MAKTLAGIYSRPSGKAGGLVWGRGRTETGKVATVREYVVPTNPRTAGQIVRRDIFSEAVGVLRTLGRALWHYDWDNGIGELPGWQSMLSWLIKQLEIMDSTIQWIADPEEVSLGPCYNPGMTYPGTGATKTIVLTWSTDIVGDHCAATDVLRGFASLKAHPDTPTDITQIPGDTLRSAGTVTLTMDQADTDYCVSVWFRHTEPDDSYTYSPTDSQIAKSHV